jgi:solute carrier family 25 (mitochondrial phosphate transporter), member 23/24/25/41
LAIFSSLKEMYVNTYSTDPTVMTLLCCGAFSGICGQLVSYPLALARTKLQVQGLPGRTKEYNGLGEVFGKTIKNEGIKGLYRGILPNFMKSVPAIAISYAVFE